MLDDDAGVAGERSRALEVYFRLGAQIRDCPDVVIVDQTVDVRGREPLQVVGSDQPVGTHCPVLGGQAADVTHIRGTVEVDPSRTHLSDPNSRGLAPPVRQVRSE
jgi:hypothetical protein